jgi:hypothetical protein
MMAWQSYNILSNYRPRQALELQEVQDPRISRELAQEVKRFLAPATGRLYRLGNIPIIYFCKSTVES